jgi:uncharacterized membrane protein
MKRTEANAVFTFRWRYVILPLIFLLISVILVAIFYNHLPFQVAYHFKSDGSGDSWVTKPFIIFWALLPQFLLTLGATAVTWIITLMATRYLEPEAALVKPQKILLFIGNMVAIPQLILDFAMLDIFTYNSYQTHLRPSVLIFALIVMVVGGVILSLFFVQTMRQVWRGSKQTLNTKY